MAHESGERLHAQKDTLPSQSNYVPGQQSRRKPVSIEVVDIGRLPTIPASQRLAPPSAPATVRPRSEEPPVRVNVRADSTAPSTRRSETPSSQLAHSPAGKVLAAFRGSWAGLRPPAERDSEFGQLRRYVSELVRGIGLSANSIYVLQMRPVKDLYRVMPPSMRETAKDGFTVGLEQTLQVPLTECLAGITRRRADPAMLEEMPEYGEFQRVIDLLDDTAGGMLPPRVLQVARDLLLMAISAHAFENRPQQHLLRPFLRMLEDGHLAVGLTKERRFLMVTL